MLNNNYYLSKYSEHKILKSKSFVIDLSEP